MPKAPLCALIAALLLVPGCVARLPPTPPLRLERLAPLRKDYTGVVLGVTAPWGDLHRVWPEEVWSWRSDAGAYRMVFSRAENIADFFLDPATGRGSYRWVGGPEGSTVAVTLQADGDSLSIRHDTRNEGPHVITGGGPCLQDPGPEWPFEQAKRTFLFTAESGLVWSSDTRRTAVDGSPGRRAYSAAYSLHDPAKRSVFGRSPERAVSPVIGYVTADRRHLVACVTSDPDEVLLGRLNCIHSKSHYTVLPGSSHSNLTKIYFVPNRPAELLARIRTDFPAQNVPALDVRRWVLGGTPRILASFEAVEEPADVRRDRVLTEPATHRSLTVETNLARTFGRTDGDQALLAEFEAGGQLEWPGLLEMQPGLSFFTLDLTLPVRGEREVRVTLRCGADRIQRTFWLAPGAPRRCVLDLEPLPESAGPVDVVVEFADAEVGLVQIDCLAVY